MNDAWRNSANSTIGGVGIRLDKNTERAWEDAQRHKESFGRRISLIRLSGLNKHPVVICAYAPWFDVHNRYHEEVAEFSTQLEQAVLTVKPQETLIILGDFNATMGRDTTGSFPSVPGVHTVEAK